MEGLLAHLADAAHDHVLDRRRIDAGALDQRIEYFGCHVGGMPVLQRPASFPTGGAGGGDDIGFGHARTLLTLT